MHDKSFLAMLCLFSISLFGGEIILPVGAGRAVKDAGSAFEKYFAMVTGKEFAKTACKIYLGSAASQAQWLTVPQDMAPEEWLIATKDDEIVITGDSSGTVWGV